MKMTFWSLIKYFLPNSENWLKIRKESKKNFENFFSKAGNLWIKFWPFDQLSLKLANIILPNLNHRLIIFQNLIFWKKLTFKGHKGQKRPNLWPFSHLLPYQTITPMCPLSPSTIFRFQKLSGWACKGGYFTVAWPSWPLKANFFSPDNFSHYPRVMVKIW